MEIEIFSNHFLLLSQKAMYWEEKKTLLIADLHLGKITHFRKEGIALPSSAYENNFKRLDEIINSFLVERIILLGDLFHNRHNEEWDLFSAWRKKYDIIEIILVLGNHDILPTHLFESSKISYYNKEYIEGNFTFSHHPQKIIQQNTFTFCGHIHPVYCLKYTGKQSLRLPCFVLDPFQAILPGFGVFTGGFEMKALDNRKFFVIAEQKVFEV
ncbi:MAG: ligase-associated DNA damage response endonuclease PdeM [Bacteroidota bacterium]